MPVQNPPYPKPEPGRIAQLMREARGNPEKEANVAALAAEIATGRASAEGTTLGGNKLLAPAGETHGSQERHREIGGMVMSELDYQRALGNGDVPELHDRGTSR